MPPPDRPCVLVTGAAGFVAYHVIERLLRGGVPVVGADSFDPLYARALKEANLRDLGRIAAQTDTEFRFLERDVLGLEEGFAGDERVGAVVHLAGRPGVHASLEAPAGYARANVEGTARVLELCRRRGIDRLVFGSSSSVYGDATPAPFREDAPAVDPVSPYGASKRAAELFCRAAAGTHGPRVALLRLFSIVGPRLRPDLGLHRFARAILDGTPLTLYGDGSDVRDCTYAGDAAEAIEASLRWLDGAAPGSCVTLNVAGGAPVAVADLVARLERRLGRKAVVDRRPRRGGDVRRTEGDVTQAREVLGWRPRTGLDEAIDRLAGWMESQR